jgi:protein involved in polysaccharide export with SLBB domain
VGGFTKTSSKGAILVIRELDTDYPAIIVIDMAKLLYQADLRQDILVKQGDIILVQTSLLGSITEFLDTFMASGFNKLVNYAETYYGFGWRRYMFNNVTGERKWSWPTGRGTAN